MARGRRAAPEESQQEHRAGTPQGSPPQGSPPQTRNEVVLVGRIAGAPEERALPSGDVIVTWRVVVDRPASRRPVPEGVRVPTVDTLDCVAWTAATRRTAGGLVAGDVVALEGALRRRFWRAGAGPASRCEIEVAKVKRLTRGPRPGAAAPLRRPGDREGRARCGAWG